MSGSTRHTVVKVLALVVMAVLATGCGAHHGQAAQPHPTPLPAEVASSGVLIGRLVGTGGPSRDTPDTPYHGEIRAVRADGSTWTARTDRQGRFRLRLPAGDYVVTGRTPEYEVGASWPCQATNGVTVLPPDPTHENVWCVRR